MKNNLTSRRNRTGFLFTLPYIIGFIMFFLIPIIQSVILSITSIVPGDRGIVYTYIGIENYSYLFRNEPKFIPNLGNTVTSIFSGLFLILVFSFFVANMLVQNFKGRTVARAVFFLPVIITSGVVISYIKGDINAQEVLSGSGQTTQMQIDIMRSMLADMNLRNDIVDAIIKILNSIFEIPWKSGIQILIFMAGLQSISPSIKEAAKVEGVTGWDFFWKITLPMLTPILQLNVIYTIIDGFTDLSNPVIKMIFNYNNKLDYGYASAISWTYFSIIFAITIVIYLLSRKKVFSYT